MPDNPFKEDKNPQNTEYRSEGEVAREATDPVEPGTVDK